MRSGSREGDDFGFFGGPVLDLLSDWITHPSIEKNEFAGLVALAAEVDERPETAAGEIGPYEFVDVAATDHQRIHIPPMYGCRPSLPRRGYLLPVQPAVPRSARPWSESARLRT